MLKFGYTAVYIGVILFFVTKNFYLEVEQNKSHSHILLSSFVPFFSLLLLIGGSIVITLSYVSWRKYKGTEYEKKLQKRNPNDWLISCFWLSLTIEIYYILNSGGMP